MTQDNIDNTFNEQQMQDEPKNLNTSFGIMNISTLNTNPLYGFGTAPRDNIDKLYINNDLAKIQLVGKQSAGPKYTVTDQFCFDKAPNANIGTEVRRDQNLEPKYQHYTKKDNESNNPQKADEFRKPKCNNTVIGKQKRFDYKQRPSTPGPKYNVNLKPEIPNSNKYSIAKKLDIPGQTVVKPLISTNKDVGPGKYLKLYEADTSELITQPKYSFTKNKRESQQNSSHAIHQTYETRSSIGNQKLSQKKSQPQVNFTKSKRYARTGQFQQNMQVQPTRVNIPMPKY